MAEKRNQYKKNTPKPEKLDNLKAQEGKKSSEQKKSVKTSDKPKKSVFRIFKDEKVHKIFGLFLALSAVFLCVAFTSYLYTWKVDDNLFHGSLSDMLFDKKMVVANYMGRLGAIFSYLFIKLWFGVASYVFILLFFVTGIRIFLKFKILPLRITYKYSLFALIWFSVSFAYFFNSPDLQILGGNFGYQSNIWLVGIFGRFGTGIIIFFSLLSFLIIAYNIDFKFITSGLIKRKADVDLELENANDDEENIPLTEEDLNFVLKNKESFDEQGLEIAIDDKKAKTSNKSEKTEIPFEINNNADSELSNSSGGNEQLELEVEVTNNIEENGKADELFTNDNNSESISSQENTQNIGVTAEDLVEELGEYDPKADLSNYITPKTELLDDYGTGTSMVQKDELEANKNKIVETLNNYAIQIDKIKATIGPTVTLYEIIPAPGIRISKIKNLEDDIALSLAALGIRIIAPIPGKGTIGIEVPNRKPEIVSMKSILSSDKFVNCTFELPIALGKTISNEIYIADLTKMPHLLMAGATGQGKSVGINAIIASILAKKHPSQVKFVLVDPKKVELTLFSKIEKHFMAKLPGEDEAIITDVKKVVKTLNALCIEMDQRYELLKNASCRQIKEYNAKFIARKLNPKNGHRYLPYIILIVDEFADLIMTAGKEVEMPIARLAQLARAIGIHLIIATQRPSVNIITGTIKANFPARIAFRVTSKIDSRTILDSGGADQLIGRGDMLISTGNDLLRIQCAFIDTHEVERLTEFIGAQQGYSSAMLLPEVQDDEISGRNDDGNFDERDPLFEEAARLVVGSQSGSTSNIQRRMKLGYNRAGRLMDQLEAAGIVGPAEGSKPRDVKIKDMMSLEQFLKTLNK